MWTPLRFPGQYHDAETDLFENWNRYYDPSNGRYLSPDPMAYATGYALEAARKGMSVPIYAYAHNNPVINTDPTGKAVPLLAAAVCGGGGCEALVASAAVGLTIAAAYVAANVTAHLSENKDEEASAPSADPADAPQIVEQEGNTVEIAAQGEQGEIRILADVATEGNTLILDNAHIQGQGKGTSSLSEMRNIIIAIGASVGAEEVIIRGQTRTSGARPNHKPREIRVKVDPKV